MPGERQVPDDQTHYPEREAYAPLDESGLEFVNVFLGSQIGESRLELRFEDGKPLLHDYVRWHDDFDFLQVCSV
jgi:hypothetical protein